MIRDSRNLKLKLVVVLSWMLFTITIGAGNANAGTLSVNSNGDDNTCDNFLTFREALLLAKGGDFLERPVTQGERDRISGGTYIPAPPPLGCPTTTSYWSITNGVGRYDDDTILFSTAVDTIQTSGLPMINWGGDTIDGLKSDGTRVALTGTAAGDHRGFWVSIHDSQASRGFRLRHMYIRDFQREGIYIEGGLNGVYEGLDIRGCGLDGIAVVPIFDAFSIYNPRNNHIGGPAVDQRNTISGNGRNGIAFYISPAGDRYPNLGNVIENNYIGINLNGPDPNGSNGIYLENAFGTLVGGDTSDSRNIISGNAANGIVITGTGAYANRVINNFIGTNIAGNAAVGNAADGIKIEEGAGAPTNPNIIGEPQKGNVISGNNIGIALLGTETNHAVIRGNWIGTDLGVNLGIGNSAVGIYVSDAHDNTIGGTGAFEENVVAYSGSTGIFVTGSRASQITMRANRIFLNGFLGIDLDPVGVSLNDPLDLDYGPNSLLNFPLIFGAGSGGGFTSVNGSINSSRNTPLVLDFFINPNSDPTGYGEGSTYIGSANVVTNNSGNASFNSSFHTVLDYSGYYATATATDVAGNTSEFSLATRIGCSYSISPSSQSFSAAGGTGMFNLTTTAACDWQAVSSANWITFTGGSSGTGSGTISFTVAPNTGPARFGTITVGGRVFSIDQSSVCTYDLSRFSATYPAAGTTGDGVSVTAGAGCTWNAVSNAPWITVTSGSSGNGNGTVSWTVAANTGQARQGTLTIAGLTFTIDQTTGCTFSLVNTAASFSAAGGTGDDTVVTDSTCSWSATSAVPWITITSGGTGIGTGSFTYSVAPNSGGARQGTITAGGQVLTIDQGAGCSYQLSRTSAAYQAIGTPNDTVDVSAGAGCDWTAVSNVPWVLITSGNSGSGPGTVSWSVSLNTGSARDGELTIAGITFNIHQSGASIIYVNSTVQSPGSSGDCTLGEAIVAANQDTQVDGCNAGSGADIISLPAGTYTLHNIASSDPLHGDNGLPAIVTDIAIQGAGAETTIIERADNAPSMFRFFGGFDQSNGSITLTDLTLRGGRFAEGGAIYMPGRSITLERAVLENNHSGRGGAIWIRYEQGGVTADNCIFRDNESTDSGGVMEARNATISNSRFVNNRAVNGGAYRYAAGSGAVLTITDTTFENNHADDYGGAVSAAGIVNITRTRFTGNNGLRGGAMHGGGNVHLIDSIIDGNTASAGGGLLLENCILNTDNTTISNNSATSNLGGGINQNAGEIHLNNTSILANRSAIDGGGVWLSTVNGTMVNTTVGSNTATEYGGGIMVEAYNPTTLSLTNVTITRNHSNLEGGGLFLFHPISYATTRNTLIAGNTTNAPTAPDIFAPNAFTSMGYNLIGVKDGAAFTNGAGDQTGTLASPIDPGLGRLGSNGGPTRTYSLLPGSRAIDQGAAVTPSLSNDQRGMSRPYDSPGVPNAADGDGSDIGAFERQESDVMGSTLFDYDGDGRSDVSVFRPSAGAWYLQRSQAGPFGMGFGLSTDKITPADFDGDGKTDISVYRPESGIWYVLNSSTGTVAYFNFGVAEDLPTPADYDGDGRADLSVFRPSTATWYRQNSRDGSFYAIQFGAIEDKPTVGDFDGDGKSDVAVFRPSLGDWYQLYSSDGSAHGERFGFGTDVITPADFDGDGKTDLAVFRTSNGFWYIKHSEAGVYTAYPFGLSADTPAAADFDGDGKADLSVFRPSDGNWYRMNSADGSFFAFQFGANGDRPTQTAFRY